MKCDKKDLLLYAVTDRSWLNGETLYSQVEKALEGGATFVQLREKHLDHDAFLQEAKEIKELCAKYQVPFVLDDDVELALEVGADGVHVGQSDMEAGDVRAKLGEDKIVGVSAQTVEQALLAQERGADYLGVGAVFPTSSKDDAVEVDVDAICDGEMVLIGGIMEHIEQAGVHSGDSACSLPAYTLSKEIQDVMRDRSYQRYFRKTGY